ncbi:efflux RND transporter permease subunit [Fodinibius salsisoli]|uniref:MMPL family transporter n=1 Tax=Fodinibius salsisoli TaxID=2820877 RepID=A0ABT3PN35_9BACT|nr:MMPL family transporter [Fodinibius salsisoli]MCW9707358.1 MMPL family transporter [Fodinibius salsisoli]
MEKILRFFRPLVKFNYNHPFWVVGITVLAAVILGSFAVQLKIDTDLANLLPKKNPHVKALEELQQTVGGETAMEVAIKSPSFEDNKRFAEDLIDKSLELYDEQGSRPFFERAEFHKETTFLRDNALYFATPGELGDIKTYLQDEIQSAKEDANPFLVDFGSEEEEETGNNKELADFEQTYEDLIPSEYPVNADSTVMVFKLYPTGSKSDLDYLRSMFSSYDSLLVAANPQSYNSAMEVRYGGRLKRHLAEIDSIMNDVFSSFASGISSVIILVMLYFFIKKYINYRKGNEQEKEHRFWEHLIRMPVPVLVIGLPLLISLSWTFGVTYFVLGTLNTMTSVLFVILFGMGIDYGLHYYARYIEFRSKGKPILEALYETYDNTGSAIVVSGLTTAFSLFVLIIAKFRGFSEFGFIAGSGIILALSCMLFVLPSLLVISERRNWILLNTNRSTHDQGASTFNRFPMARSVVVVGLLIAVFVGMNYQKLDFQYDFGELEPEFPEYRSFNKFAGQVSHSDKRNPAYILADNQEQVIQILEKIRYKMKTDTTSPTILDVEALPERFPPTEAGANEKLKEISRIRELLNDPFIKGQDDSQLDKLRRAAQTKTQLAIDQIPDYFKSQFVTKQGEIGNFVIVYPSVGLSDGEKSIAFKNDIGEIQLDSGETFYAASTSIIAAEMLDLMRTESPYMVGATFLVVFLLMLISFRSLRWAIIAMLPLLVGLLWLFGIMMLTGMMFNFYNLVVLPAILGIGEDNGVHLAHRYREEGERSMWDVLSSTGQHVTIGSLTTMLGFSGLLFTNHPGLQSLGQMAVIGIGMTLVAALTFLPALIERLEDREWIRF